MIRVLLAALLAATLTVNVRAQNSKFLGFSSLEDTIADTKKGLFFLPLLYYTPDTRWAYGGAGVYYFRIAPKDSTQQETRTDYVQFLADYTQNRQLDVWSTWNIFTRNEDYLLKGDLRFRNFPDRFYGIGNTSEKADMEKYEYNLIQLKSMFLKKVRHDLFMGFDYEFEKEYGFRYTEGGVLGSGAVSGSLGGIGSAIGLVAIHDSRDNIINAYRGSLIEASSYFFTPILGSTFKFTNINFTFQKYWEVKRKHVLAFQTKMKFSIGEVPFLDMATLGNDDILRGYPKNRFRDKNFVGSQVEYRFPLFWRFGAVTFAGLGDVFETPGDVGWSTLKYSVGGGLRFVVNPAERLNIRLDYGHGREGGYFYFMVAEAF